MAKKRKFYESDFEEAVVQKLQAEGWTYTHAENLHNRSLEEALITDDLKSYLTARYQDKNLTTDEIEAIVARLRYCGGNSDYEVLFNTVHLYQDGFDFVYSDGRAPAFHLDYIDFDNPSNNIFRVVNQFEMHEGKEVRIPDVMLFINGIPVCIIELKNPTDEKATIRDAHTQITVRYNRDIHSLLKYCAVAVISDGSNSRIGSTISDYEFFYAWKKIKNEDNPEQGIAQLDTLIQGALTPKRLLSIIRDFVYFPDKGFAFEQAKDGKVIEVVCRYPQFFATRRLRDNILLHLRSQGGDGKGGTYFGATGCGKTYTMLFLTRQLALRCNDKVGSPTVLIIVDREDLETQTGKLFMNSVNFLSNGDVKIFESRAELAKELQTRTQGGVYITTIQKFSAETGLLSERSNIICISDEAHRSQNNTGSKLKIVDGSKKEDCQELAKKNAKLGAFITYGFAKFLRDALPNATYVGFTGTPIDETIHVFGGVVDQYTMSQAHKDGITVNINYVPRLVKVNLNEQQTNLIEAYYKQCEEEGAKSEDVDTSKNIMSSINAILGNPERLDRMARDIIAYWEKRLEDQPDQLQKAMIVCNEREIAVNLYNIILQYRPEWGKSVKALDESKYTAEELKGMEKVPYINVVATRDKDDPKPMYNLLGDKQYRKELDRLFKADNSNFHIAIVVDMWITGFDVPSLTVLFNDKPLQKHTLIQTVSRVNRVFPGKECGVIVDYLGIHENFLKAMKKYGGNSGDGGETGDINLALEIFRAELEILKKIMEGFDFSRFFGTNPMARLQCLQDAVEFLLMKEVQGVLFDKIKMSTAFKGHVKRMRGAFNICNPAGVLTDEEVAWAQLFMGIYSYLIKITDTHHDVESMNKVVEKMVEEALSCGNVETIFDMKGEIGIYSDEFLKEMDDVKLPCTKFELLVKLLRRAIKEYSKSNKTRADHFTKLLQATIDEYHNRDNYTFVTKVTRATITPTVEMVEGRITELTDKLKDIFEQLQTDKIAFKKLGISFEEKAFYDILIEVRDTYQFEYPNEKCKILAKKIKNLIDEFSIEADWVTNGNIRNKVAKQLTILLYKADYPTEWDDLIFKKVIDQVEKFNDGGPVSAEPEEEYVSISAAMAAEPLAYYGSIDVMSYSKPDAPSDMVLMYAVGPASRQKTEQSGKIALGIKESALSEDTIRTYEQISHLIMHYWKNETAGIVKLLESPKLVDEKDVPEDYLLRQPTGASKYLLLSYDPSQCKTNTEYNILGIQRQGDRRYLPFVIPLANIPIGI